MIQYPVPENILRSIGRITVSFAGLELALKMLTGSFIAEHQRATQIITCELSFNQTLALAQSLYLERHGKDNGFEVLKNLLDRSAKIADRRNAITHSIQASGGNPSSVTRIKMTAKRKHGLNAQFETMTEEDFKTVVEEMDQVADETQQLMLQLIGKKKAVNNPLKKFW